MTRGIPWYVWAAVLLVAAYVLTPGLEQLLDVAPAGGVRLVPSAQVRIWLDPETGCEYFVPGFRPRLRPDATPICSPDGRTSP